ncbi:TPA: hypothetical protein ACPWS4_003963 [Pseudomonas aeruginosa]
MTTEYAPEQIEAAAVFLARMQPYLLQGMTFEQAGQAVLKRDREIVQIVVSDPERMREMSDMIAQRIYEPCKVAYAEAQRAKVASEDRGYNQL